MNVVLDTASNIPLDLSARAYIDAGWMVKLLIEKDIYPPHVSRTVWWKSHETRRERRLRWTQSSIEFRAELEATEEVEGGQYILRREGASGERTDRSRLANDSPESMYPDAH